MKNFEANPDLVPKTNNKLLKDAIEVAKKIIDGDITYEKEYEKFLEANKNAKSNKRKASESLEKEEGASENDEKKNEEDGESKPKTEKKQKEKKSTENGEKKSKKVKSEGEKKDEKDEKKPRKKTEKAEKKQIKKTKPASPERSEDESESNEIPNINRSQSFNIDPIIEGWAKKLDNIIKDLLSEDATADNQIENFTLVEEIIKELRDSQTDFVSLLHTQFLKKLNFIVYVIDKFYSKKKDVRILDSIRTVIDNYRNELVTNAFDISDLKKSYSEQLDNRSDL